jgi:membrane-associated phospholipid phosphatase
VQKGSLAPAACRWCAANPLDEAVRSGLVWSPSRIAAADTLSSVIGYGVVPVSAAALTAFAAAHDGRSREIPADVLIIAESGILAMDLNQAVKLAVGRQRPFVHFHTGTGDPTDDNLSFFSGHATAGFSLAVASGTVATMRGYRWAPWVWAQGLALAVGTAYLRVAADKHYFTDVLTGAAVGSGVGFAVPYLLHRPSAGAPPVLPSASASRDGGSFRLTGRW